MSPATAESICELRGLKMKRTKGVWGDVWRYLLGGGSGNTGSGG